MLLKFVKLIKWLLNLKVCDIFFQPSDSSPGGGVGTEDGDPFVVSHSLITTNNRVKKNGWGPNHELRFHDSFFFGKIKVIFLKFRNVVICIE